MKSVLTQFKIILDKHNFNKTNNHSRSGALNEWNHLFRPKKKNHGNFSWTVNKNMKMARERAKKLTDNFLIFESISGYREMYCEYVSTPLRVKRIKWYFMRLFFVAHFAALITTATTTATATTKERKQKKQLQSLFLFSFLSINR